MGFFKNLFSKNTSQPSSRAPIHTIDQTELALQLLNTHALGGTIDNRYRPYIEKFQREHDARIESLKAIAEMCLPADTPKKLYVASTAYVYAGATCRKEAIDCLNQFIACGMWEGLPSSDVEYDGKIVNQKTLRLQTLYIDLGKAYEGEYMLEEAEAAYHKAMAVFPNYSGCQQLSGVLVKLGRFDEAIALLQEYRKYPYLQKDALPTVDEKITDIKKKKARGYKYRPRPQH